jgi:type II restriction enzyme
MPNLTPADLLQQIALLDENRSYPYVSGANTLSIAGIQYPTGPIAVSRQGRGGQPKAASISAQMLATAAFAFANKPNYPIHFDRLFSAGGNSRSALETLLAHTPHFFVCNPERIDIYRGETKKDLKHLMWCPNEAHTIGRIEHKDYNQIITEVELGIDFGGITGITAADLGTEFDSIEARKTHTQMQVALIEIGRALNFRT